MLIQHLGRFHLSDSACRRLAQRCTEAGVALLLVLSEVFSSNIQSTLPAFSTAARLCLTGGALLLLGFKCLFLTRYETRGQWAALFLTLAYTGFAALYGGDEWFLLAALVGLAAKDADLRRLARVYLAVAAAGLVLVQLLHLLTPLVPFKFYCRNWDFGYGHYNGYGARLMGVFLAWGWLRWPRLRWFDWAGLAALAVYTLTVPVCRGAGGAMLLLLALFAAQKLLPRLFESRLYHGLVLAVYPLLTALSLLTGYLFDTADPDHTPVLKAIDRLLSGRFEIWHNVFWQTPASLLGGVPTDGDEHSSIDNMYLALPMNKGVLGAVLVAAVFLILLWRLAKGRHTGELLCMTALLAYLFMENKPFLLSANPLVLLLPCVFFARPDRPLPVLCPRAEQPQPAAAGQAR
ncbi:MAG TPA: hypothetical protein H9915_10885 [Candidatus Gemmiger faecigallinarum]|nr:hypothetical protein [Candidatus Gemmiger faecigallinarum]